MSSISSFFSSLVGSLHADAPEEAKISEAQPQEEVVAVEADEDEEEPEDVRLPVLFVRGAFPLSQVFWACQIHPQLREEAQESPKCKAAAQHFFHCQEKVQSGKGFKHEDCVEEMCVFFCILPIYTVINDIVPPGVRIFSWSLNWISDMCWFALHRCTSSPVCLIVSYHRVFSSFVFSMMHCTDVGVPPSCAWPHVDRL